MPKLPTTCDPMIEHAIAAFEEFEKLSAWKRSRKGNLWRHWEGMTVTVFSGNDESYRWSVADGDSVRYSHGSFESEADAVGSLGESIGVGEV